MEGSYKLQALQEYDRALRRGRREYSTLTAKGERGILVVLDELTQENRILAYVKQPSREISMSSIMLSEPQEDGLITTVFPAARIAQTFWQPIMNGPFQGNISPTTPQGCQRT